MLQEFVSDNSVDKDGMPAGGFVSSIGLDIRWQKGPLGEEGIDRLEPNGAFVETVIAAALQRIEWYQMVCDGRFACDENHFVIGWLKDSLRKLDERTKSRQARGVEGTHKV